MKKLLNNNTLLYFQDIGSSEYLLDSISNYNFNRKLYYVVNDAIRDIFMEKSKSTLKKNNIIFVKNTNKIFFIKFIEKNNIMNVISTCASNKIDKSNQNLFRACISKNIKINTFIDHWKGDDRLDFFKKKSSFFNIGLLDKNHKTNFIKTMPLSKLFIIGHPTLEKIKKNHYKRKKSILIVSEPMTNNKFRSCFTVKYKKLYFVDLLINYLKKNFHDYKIYYRPHPKEDIKYVKKIKHFFENKDQLISLNLHELYVGFESMFLYKAKFSGAKVIQLSNSFREFKDFNFKNNYTFSKFNIKPSSFKNSEYKAHQFFNKVLI